MADHHLTFRIGTVFSDSGAKAAQTAVKGLAGPVRKSAELLSQMGSAMGGLDTSAARCVGALTGVMQTLVSLSLPAIILQGAIMAVTFVINKLNERSEEAKKKAEELSKKLEAAFDKALADRIKAVNERMSELAGDFDRVTRQAKEFSAALAGVKAADAQSGIVSLEIEKLNALLTSRDEAESELVEATYNLAIARERATVRAQAAEAELSVAEQELVDNINRRGIIENQLSVLGKEIEALEEQLVANRYETGELDKEGLKIQKAVTDLKKREEKLLSEKQELDHKAIIQERKIAAERIKVSTAIQEGEKMVKEVELQNKKAADAAALAAAKTVAASTAADAAASAAAEYKTRLDEAAKLQGDANAGKKALAEAEKNFAAALGRFNADFANNNLFGKLGQLANKAGGMVAGFNPADLKRIEAENVNHQLVNALAQGQVRNVKDLQRLERELQRQERDRTNAAKNIANNEKARYDRLKNMNPKLLSDKDKKFMEDFEKVRGANEKPMNDLQAARQNLDKMKKSLENIEEKLELLGLK